MTKLSKRIIFRARINGVNEHIKKFDFYETPTWGTELLLSTIEIPVGAHILEPCNGPVSVSYTHLDVYKRQVIEVIMATAAVENEVKDEQISVS